MMKKKLFASAQHVNCCMNHHDDIKKQLIFCQWLCMVFRTQYGWAILGLSASDTDGTMIGKKRSNIGGGIMKIAINGSLGSGKSTVAKQLAGELGWTYLSTGDRFRAMAKEMDLSVAEFSKIAEQRPEIDQAIDDWLRSFNDSDANLILDSRMAPFFIQDALKVRLLVSDEEGARRIFLDNTRGSVESFARIEQAEEAFRIRSQSESKRYSEKYGVNVEDPSSYNVIIDTSFLSVAEVCQQICDALPTEIKQ